MVLSTAVYTGGVGAQDVINGGLYRQCRGEWKLARVASAVSAGDRLWVARLVLRATFQSPLQLRVAVQDVINGGLYRQCRGEWKLARVVSAGDRLWVAGLVLRATFQSPLQLRGVVHGVINGDLYRQGRGTGCY